ncbi:hypothetical protein THC_1545 [Caldimicrobium thiodismutans]|uniref:Lipoprotein n=1 Tax=Caldimicrobium thiodismutans TaxID=1653476 RepID=A0A0U4N3P0_9BACT|nr:LptE family protein [Caldimicrobium thiodismutans]BAU23910.1 hypothetical protein THC_1545 [Caldimicrobium thiodismutans]
MFLSISLWACGYTLQERPSYFKSHWKTIYIPPFKNYTQESEMGELLAYELRHRFSQGRLLIPVYREEEADLIFKGEITRVYVEPVSYEVFLQTKERKILFEGKFQLIERITQEKIYENRKFNRFETYRVSEALTGLLDPGKKEALKKLSKDISELIFQEIFFK